MFQAVKYGRLKQNGVEMTVGHGSIHIKAGDVQAEFYLDGYGGELPPPVKGKPSTKVATEVATKVVKEPEVAKAGAAFDGYKAGAKKAKE